MPEPRQQQHPALPSNHSPEFGCQVAKVLPGQLHVSADGTAIATVLGSCVAVCLYDQASGVGGLNHFLLPHSPGGRQNELLPTRYGKEAMEALIAEMIRAGARRDHLEAKIFGGACVIRGLSVDIGQRNASFIRAYLKDQKIRVVAEDMEGSAARKIVFFPDSGRVLCKRVLGGSQELLADIEHEVQYALQAGGANGRTNKPANGQVLKEEIK